MLCPIAGFHPFLSGHPFERLRGMVARLSKGLAVAAVAGLLTACASGNQEGTAGQGRSASDESAYRTLDEFLRLNDQQGPADTTGVTGISLEGAAKVGLLLPLSGQHAAVGQALLNAAQLAVYDIADEKFELIVRDTKGTPEGASEAFASATAGGAQLILGPLFFTSVEAIAEAAELARVPVISFSNNRDVAGESIFVMGLAPKDQVARAIGYAISQGLREFAVLAPDSEYGASVVAAMQEALFAGGAELTRVTFFPPESSDISAEVRSIADYDQRRAELLKQRSELEARNDEAAQLALKRLEDQETLGPPPFEAVLLPEGGQRLLTVAPLMAFYDVDPSEVQFLGTALWDEPGVRTEPVLEGGWFAAPTPSLWEAFQDRYSESFGTPPPRIATLSYDATALAAVLAQQAGLAGREVDFSPGVLTQPTGFAGIDGIFRFLPTGEVERGLAMLEVDRDGFVVIDAAPGSFEELIN